MIFDRIKDYVMLGLGILILILGMSLAVQSARLKAEKAEHKAFVAEVKGVGLVAQAKADRQKKDDIARERQANAENTKSVAALRAANKQLRDERAGRNILPAPSPGAASPERITFDRAELESALRRLDAGVSSLVAEGDEARVNLDTAKGWAQK